MVTHWVFSPAVVGSILDISWIFLRCLLVNLYASKHLIWCGRSGLSTRSCHTKDVIICPNLRPNLEQNYVFYKSSIRDISLGSLTIRGVARLKLNVRLPMYGVRGACSPKMIFLSLRTSVLRFGVYLSKVHVLGGTFLRLTTFASVHSNRINNVYV